MADTNEENPVVRIAGRGSVNMAVELLRTVSSKTRKRKRNEESEDSDKVASHCLSNLVEKKEPNAALGFSENYAITEMRSCLARRDWASLRELLPLLLGCYSEIEPILWRHALTLLLCSPDSDSLHFQEFLEMCIGARTLEDNYLLERLLTLQNKNS